MLRPTLWVLGVCNALFLLVLVSSAVAATHEGANTDLKLGCEIPPDGPVDNDMFCRLIGKMGWATYDIEVCCKESWCNSHCDGQQTCGVQGSLGHYCEIESLADPTIKMWVPGGGLSFPEDPCEDRCASTPVDLAPPAGYKIITIRVTADVSCRCCNADGSVLMGPTDEYVSIELEEL